MGGYVHVRSSERIRKSQQRFDPRFEAEREWNIEAVESLVYNLKYGDYYSNIYKGNIILDLLNYWDAEYCMDTPSELHMRIYYVIKPNSQYYDDKTYMEKL